MSSLNNVENNINSDLLLQLNFFDTLDNNIILQNDELLQKIEVIRQELYAHISDYKIMVKIRGALQKIYVSIYHPSNLKHSIPQLIAFKNNLIPNFDFYSAIMSIINSYNASDQKSPEMLSHIVAFFRKIVETGYCDLYGLSSMFSFIFANDPFDEETARFMVSKHPTLINAVNQFHAYPVLAELISKPLPLSESDLQKIRFCICSGADLSHKARKSEEIYNQSIITPIIVKAAKNGNIDFFQMLLPYLEPQHLQITDSLGCNARYYLVKANKNVPEEILQALANRNDELSPSIRNYPDGVYLQRPLELSEHSDNLGDFVSAWRSKSSTSNRTDLRIATQVLFTQHPLVNYESDVEKLIEIWEHFSKDLPKRSEVPFFVCMKVLEANTVFFAHLSQKVAAKVIESMDFRYCNNVSRILDNMAKNCPEGFDILKALHKYVGGQLLQSFTCTPPQPIVDYLHDKGESLSNKQLIEAIKEHKSWVFPSVLALSDRYKSFVNSSTFQNAQKEGHYEFAIFLRDLMGEKFLPLMRNHLRYLQKVHLNIDDDAFDGLIQREIDYVDQTRLQDPTLKPYAFDCEFLQRISQEFLQFWRGQTPPYDDFEARLSVFPYKGSINFLRSQKLVWDEFQKDDRTKFFPIEEIWRYGIDYYKVSIGPCAFEQEPGYMNGFLQGLAFALQTSEAPKTPDWYVNQHTKIVEACSSPQEDGTFNFKTHLRNWNAAHSYFDAYNTNLRTSSVQWGVLPLDRDPIGLQDLERNRFWKLEVGIMKCNYGDEKASLNVSTLPMAEAQLNRTMTHYLQLLANALTRAERLMVSLGFGRELEIHHYFNDANGRSSHLAFASLIAGQKDLPFFLFPDPNVFDGNGPESLAFRYLEACLNFRRGGQSNSYVLSNQIKSLDSLDLTGHEDLQMLREELRPLVVGKDWSEVTPLLENTVFKNAASGNSC